MPPWVTSRGWRGEPAPAVRWESMFTRLRVSLTCSWTGLGPAAAQQAWAVSEVTQCLPETEDSDFTLLGCVLLPP